MRMPLNELRAKLQTLRENVAAALQSLEEGLQRRAEAAAVRSTLELLLDTSHVLSKVGEQGTGARVSDSLIIYNFMAGDLALIGPGE